MFLAGTATVHGQRGIWGTDGRWAITDLGEQPYRTRLLVRRPADPARFSGTVVVSWLNVERRLRPRPRVGAAGRRARARGRRVRRRVRAVARRRGPARRAALGPAALRIAHPARRQPRPTTSSRRPAEAIRSPGAVDPLARARRATARLHRHGRSRSRRSASSPTSTRSSPSTDVFDGFLLLVPVPGGGAAGHAGAPLQRRPSTRTAPTRACPTCPTRSTRCSPARPRAQVRTDTDVPVFIVLTETEAAPGPPRSPGTTRTCSAPGRWPARRHVDTTATAARSWPGSRATSRTSPLDPLECAQPNDFPTRYALRAARAGAGRLGRGRHRAAHRAAARARRRSASSAATPTATPTAACACPEIDGAHRDLLGRVRRERVLRAHRLHVPFPTERAGRALPDPEAYAAEVTAAADAAVEAGYLLPEDAAEIVATATDAWHDGHDRRRDGGGAGRRHGRARRARGWGRRRPRPAHRPASTRRGPPRPRRNRTWRTAAGWPPPAAT